MPHRKKKRLIRVGGLALCLCILLSCLPTGVFALTEDGLCEHHPEHTEECGYIEGEMACGYVCEECVAPEEPKEEPGEGPEDEPAPEETPEDQVPAPISNDETLTEETAAVQVVKDGTTTYYASFDNLVAGSIYGTEDITILKDTTLNTACNNFGCNSLTVNAGVTLTLNADLYFVLNTSGNSPLSGSGTIAGSGTLTACGDVSGLTISCPLKMKNDANSVSISSGTFSNSVTISGSFNKITGGTFSGTVNVEDDATIEGGTFHGTVNNNANHATINNGTFTGTVNNENGEIRGGTFSGMVNNYDLIYDGTFNGGVENRDNICGGTFNCMVKNASTGKYPGVIMGGNFNGQIINYGYVLPDELYSMTLGEKFSIINYGEVECGDNHIRNNSNICRLCGDGCTHESWESGICKTCGTVCQHESYENGKCTVCGDPCPHESYQNGKCTVCGSYQSAVLNNGVYEISNASQLCWFAEFVNAVNTTANAVLTADIDLAGIDWTPIGLYTDDPATKANNAAYSGTFDGQYHVISNLSVDISKTNYEAGLFSRVKGGGVLKNFGIVNATITQTSNGHENKGVRAGVVAGEIFGGTVTNVFTAGNLTISTQHEQKGGIAGECASSTLTSCHTTYDILTTKVSVDSYTPTISRCYYMAEEANSNSYGEYRTEAEFSSGEVAYEMNGQIMTGVWKQTIGTNKYPQFTGKQVYYGFTSCSEEEQASYTNNSDVSSTRKAHNFVDGECSVCHALKIHELSVDSGSITLSEENGTTYYQQGNGEKTAYTGALKITGTTAENTINVKNGIHTVFFDSLCIAMKDQIPLVLESGAVNLTLNGENVLGNGGYEAQSILLASGTTLTITAASTGTLYLTNGIADQNNYTGSSFTAYTRDLIDGDGSLCINGGTVGLGPNASTDMVGGGIGIQGDLTVSGGSLTVGFIAAKNVKISGGTVTVKGLKGLNRIYEDWMDDKNAPSTTHGIFASNDIVISGGVVDVLTEGPACSDMNIYATKEVNQSHALYAINSVTISGGTVEATVQRYGYCLDEFGMWALKAVDGADDDWGYGIYSGSITITGGNVKVSGKESTNVTPTNGTVSVYENFLTLQGITSPVRITGVQGISGYGLGGVMTLDTNKLYFYLPDGANITEVTAGGGTYAGTLTDRSGTYTYIGAAVASVTITWGAMNFTYSDGTWNTGTYVYDGAGWTSEGNTVTVANTGNVGITASVAYQNENGYNFTGNWDKETASIPKEKSETFTLTLSGKPAETLDKKKVGTVTVTIQQADQTT